MVAMRALANSLTEHIQSVFSERNQIFEEFFSREAPALARVCRDMSERFLKGGRLLAFGKGPYITDARRSRCLLGYEKALAAQRTHRL